MSETTSSYLDPEVRAAISEATPLDGPPPWRTKLPGLELVPPGVARQVEAEHDVQVGALQALLAEARQAEARAVADAATARLRADVYASELAGARELLALPTVQDVALGDVVDAARAVVEAGRGTPGSTERRKRLERALATVVEPLAVVVAAARWTDRYGRVGAVEALTALEDAVRALPAEEAHRG
ncbi:hypothetical protein [Cellulosimicrobium protaetiae]